MYKYFKVLPTCKMLMMFPDLYALSNGALGFPVSSVQHAEMHVEGKYSFGE
jgi:hypothetical protein